MLDKITTCRLTLLSMFAMGLCYGVMLVCIFTGHPGWVAIFGLLGIICLFVHDVSDYLANSDIHQDLRKLRKREKYRAKREKILAEARRDFGDELADQLAAEYPAP